MAAPTKRAKAAKPKTPAKRGRPSTYRAIYAEQVQAFCLLGADDAKLCELFEINESTLTRWKQRHPEFRQAIKEGKEVADANVASALYMRAVGYSHPDIHVSNFQGSITVTPITKHYPPETAAGIFWLKNRQPKRWKDRVEIKEEINLNVFPPKEVLDAIYEKSFARAEQREIEMHERRKALREKLGILPRLTLNDAETL